MSGRYRNSFKSILVFMLASFFIMNMAFFLISMVMHPFFNWLFNDAWEIEPYFLIKRFFITVNVLAIPVGILFWIQSRLR